jgi:hypothetical protein
MKLRDLWVGAALVVLGASGCGDDGAADGGGTTSAVPSALEMSQSCTATCDKQRACLGATAGAALDCAALCAAEKFPARTDCDYGAMRAKLEACTAGGCSQIVVCEAEALVICPPPPGAGGPAPGVCDDCDRVSACCQTTLVPAGTDPGTCQNFSRSICEGSPAKEALASGCTAAAALCPP